MYVLFDFALSYSLYLFLSLYVCVSGTIGVITEAVVRVCKKPAVVKYGSMIFPDFDAGVAMMHEVHRNCFTLIILIFLISILMITLI